MHRGGALDFERDDSFDNGSEGLLPRTVLLCIAISRNLWTGALLKYSRAAPLYNQPPIGIYEFYPLSSIQSIPLEFRSRIDVRDREEKQELCIFRVDTFPSNFYS